MSIEHRNITDPEIHEPKGIASAAANTGYVSNGSGSGTWKRPDSTTLKGLTGDGGNTNKLLVTDGSNGFTLKTRAAFGGMTITGNTANFAMTAAVDPTLGTNSDFVLFTGTGAPWVADPNNFNVGVLTDRITITETGIYEVLAWATIGSFPTNTTKIAMKYRLNGTTFSARRPIVKSNSAGDNGNLTGFGIVPLTAGDYIQLYFASTATGNLIIQDMNAAVILLRGA